MIRIYEQTTPAFTGLLTDEYGNAIDSASINYFHATLYDKSTGGVINSRDDIDLYDGGNWTADNGMKATIDGSGNCTIRLSADDTKITTAANKGEIHVLQIVVKTTGTLQTVLVEIFEHYVENLTKL